VAAAYTQPIQAVAMRLHQPHLKELARRFLYNELYATGDNTADDVPLNECPELSGHISVHYSAAATFYAPSELSGTGGLHREIIRSNPAWQNAYPRYDTVLINIDPTADGMHGMLIARVKAFISFTYDQERYSCALVEWFETDGEGPDAAMGLWRVKPEIRDGLQSVAIVPINSVVRAVHLIGVCQDTVIPSDLYFFHSLDAFEAFYVNKYADYHSHETVF
jgi:hypothetical protein